MKTLKRLLGDRGERSAAKYLQRNRYRILHKNYVIGKLEVDIIAENAEHLVFAEVKTRTYTEGNEARFGTPKMAVDRKKQENLIAAATAYIRRFPTQKRIRFDILEVYVSADGRECVLSVNHIPDAFHR